MDIIPTYRTRRSTQLKAPPKEQHVNIALAVIGKNSFPFHVRLGDKRIGSADSVAVQLTRRHNSVACVILFWPFDDNRAVGVQPPENFDFHLERQKQRTVSSLLNKFAVFCFQIIFINRKLSLPFLNSKHLNCLLYPNYKILYTPLSKNKNLSYDC